MFLFADSFNLYAATANMALRWDNQAGTTLQWQSSGGRFSGACLLNDPAQASGGSLTKSFPACGEVAGNEFFFSFALGVTALPGSTSTSRPFKMAFDSTGASVLTGANSHLSLRVLGDGTLEAYRDTTLIAASASGVILANTWHRIEGKLLVAASGTLEVRVDGVAVITFSGNTKNASYAASIGAFILTGTNLGGATPNEAWRVQDIALWRAGGGPQDTWMGDFIVTTALPSADGDTVDGTPNVGLSHNAVDDTGAGDGDTTYQRMTVVNDLDLFEHAALSATDIRGVHVHIYARGDGPGTRQVKHAVKSGGTVYLTATAQTIPGQASYVNRDAFFAEDPDTSLAWTTADLDAAQFGYKMTA